MVEAQQKLQIRMVNRQTGGQMIERTQRKKVSRRNMFPFLGLAVAVGLVVQAADAEAQTAGMERRQQRREQRHERRAERRAQRRGGQPAQNAPAPSQPAPAQPAKTQ